MVILLIVGLSIVCVWIWSMLFMLAIIEGGHRVRGHGYEQKLYLRSMDKNQNIEDSIKKELEEDCKNWKESKSAHK